jgi:peptide/nickel transport system ATP-binding protein
LVDAATGGPLLAVERLDVAYGRPARPWSRRRPVAAVRGVSFAIAPGEIFALVGESGSGKSSVARAVEGLVPVAGGRILLGGRDVTRPVGRRDRAAQRQVQIVFQNPDASLNPRHSVATILGRPLAVFHGLGAGARRQRIAELLADVQLDPACAHRLPGQLSGGERQRVAIARALAAEPALLLCDEILSALDVSVQAGVIALVQGLQRERGLACLFISHDLAVVRWLAHRVGVLLQGELVESGPVEALFRLPHHPYTALLLAAVPRLDGPGPAPPAASEQVAPAAPGLCPFLPRCPHRVPACAERSPPVQRAADGHDIRCHLPVAELARRQAAA